MQKMSGRAVQFFPLFLSLFFMFSFNSASLAADETVTLTVWDFKSTEEWFDNVQGRIDRMFTEENPGISLDRTGFFDQEYIPALRTALLAGTAPDILFLHLGIEFSEFQSYLEPLDGFLEQSGLAFQENSLETGYSSEGALKALPFSVQGIGWYYNRELFEQAGLDPDQPPSEWEDFLGACEQLKASGITPIASGNNRPMTTEFIRRSLISAFFTPQEIADFYKQGRGVSNPRFRTIMDFCRTLRDKGYFDEEGLFRPYFNYAFRTFESGEAAIIPGLLSDISHWKQFSDALGADNVGYFPNLIHPDMVSPGAQLLQYGGILVCINKDSGNKDEAFAYIQHLFKNESRKILMEDLGLLSPLKKSVLPLDRYPVLKDISRAMDHPSPDPELYVPSVYVSDVQYRLDDLLINTREISVDEYLVKILNELKLY